MITNTGLRSGMMSNINQIWLYYMNADIGFFWWVGLFPKFMEIMDYSVPRFNTSLEPYNIYGVDSSKDELVLAT